MATKEKDVVQTTADAPICSRCEGPRDTEGYPKWCKECRAKYRREFRDTEKEMRESRGFAAGCTAMRNAIAIRFQGYGSAIFSGVEAGHIAMKTTSPGDEPVNSNGG